MYTLRLVFIPSGAWIQLIFDLVKLGHFSFRLICFLFFFFFSCSGRKSNSLFFPPTHFSAQSNLASTFTIPLKQLSWVFLSYILPYLSITFNIVDLSLFWKYSLSLVSRAPHLVVNGSSCSPKLMISPLNLILCCFPLIEWHHLLSIVNQKLRYHP